MNKLVEETKVISDIRLLNNNEIIAQDIFGNQHANMSCRVKFYGNNNVLLLEEGIDTTDIVVEFKGDMGLVYISKNFHHYNIHIAVSSGGVVFIGRNIYTNPGKRLELQAYEKQNIIMGNDSLFSLNVTICTSDAHKIYGFTGERVNIPSSVLIGDHVWVGQDSIILKGTVIGSGAIIGTHSVLTGGITVASNTIVAGNPATVIKEGVFFTKQSVIWEDYEETMHHNGDEYIYQGIEKEIELKAIDLELKLKCSALEKLDIIRSRIIDNTDKNRFAVG